MKRLIHIAGLALALFGTHGCDQQPDSNTITVFDPDLAAAFERRETTLATPRPAIRFQDGFVADSCNAYLEHREASDVSETVDNQLIKSEYVVCELLALIGSNEVTYSSYSKDREIADKLKSGLDLTAFPSSLAQIVSEDHQFPTSLEALEFKLETLPAGLRISRDQQSLSITVVAAGDVDGDGRTDWIVTLSDEILEATYRDYGIGVISAPNARSLLVLERL